MELDVGMGVKGEAQVVVMNLRSGVAQTITCSDCEILDSYLDSCARTGGRPAFQTIACFLGDSDTPVSFSDTGLKGSQIATESSKTQQKANDLTEEDSYYYLEDQIEYIFLADGSKTGTVKELYFPSRMRAVLDTPIDKDEFTLITVTASMIVKSKCVWEGTIQDAIPGELEDEPVDWRLTINNAQFKNFGLSTWLVSGGGYNPPRPILFIGDSNAETDMASPNRLKGSLLEKVGVTGVGDDPRILNPDGDYVPGSFSHKTRVFLQSTAGNYNIYEICLSTAVYGLNWADSNSACRITFDPALPKTDDWILYINVTYSVFRIADEVENGDD